MMFIARNTFLCNQFLSLNSEPSTNHPEPNQEFYVLLSKEADLFTTRKSSLYTISLNFVYFSPFNIAVQPGSDADKVKVTGDGIKPTVLASMPVQFTIDTRDCKLPAETDVVIQVSRNLVEFPLNRKSEGRVYGIIVCTDCVKLSYKPKCWC